MLKQLFKQITTSALLVLFLVPNVVPALHELLEHHHHHDVCTAVDQLHWHDDVAECELCDYLIGIKPFHNDEQEERVPSNAPVVSMDDIQVAIAERTFVTPHLRGPPTV